MQFETEAQRACWERVRQYLREGFGEIPAIMEDKPVFLIRMGSTVVQGSCYPWGEEKSVVTNRAYVVLDVEVDLELATFLLRKTNELRFGAFGMDEDGDIFFEHTVLGDTLDAEELKSSVRAVMSTADRYDDEIAARWGGRRAADALS